MAPPPARPASGSSAPELRRHLLFLVLSVLALDGVMLVVRRVLGVEGWPLGRQQLFTAIWVLLTLAVVLVFMQRIRVTRVRARRARAQGR